MVYPAKGIVILTMPFSFLNEVVRVHDFGILLRDLLNAIRSLISCN